MHANDIGRLHPCQLCATVLLIELHPAKVLTPVIQLPCNQLELTGIAQNRWALEQHEVLPRAVFQGTANSLGAHILGPTGPQHHSRPGLLERTDDFLAPGHRH